MSVLVPERGRREVMFEVTLVINRRLIGRVAGLLAVFGLLFYLTNPMWHWLFFGWVWRHIVGWIATVSLFGTAVYCAFQACKRWFSEYGGKFRWNWLGWAFLPMALWLGYLYFSADTYGRAVAHSFEPKIVRELPNTTSVRYLPYEVALTYARARQENPTKQVGDIDPIQIGEKFFWLAPRIPNGIANSLFSQTDGVVLISDDGGSKFEPQSFTCGEGMAIRDAVAWRLFSKRFAAEYPEIFYLRIEDEWVAIAPYVTYRFVFPVFVPQWGGVMLVHPDCVIEDLTPAQAQADPRLEGQRLFPEALARAYAGAWGYRFGGLWNIIFLHREQVEIPNLEGTENEMPYFLPTSWGPQWMIATEPSGPSQAIFKIFWFDAHTGEARLTEFTEVDALIGPNRGAQFAKGETSGYVWRESGKEGETGTYLAIEPRPTIRSGALYWQYSVTTFEYTGVGLTILVDSLNTENVLHFCSRASLLRWIDGEGGPDSVPCPAAGVATPTKTAPTVVPIGDLQKLTDEELYQLLRQIADELEQRQ